MKKKSREREVEVQSVEDNELEFDYGDHDAKDQVVIDDDQYDDIDYGGVGDQDECLSDIAYGG